MKFALRSARSAVAIGLAGCWSVAFAGVLEIATLSNRPNLVSGGNVLVQITADVAVIGAVTLNGADVTGMFRPGTAVNTFVGLVTGLNLGANTLAAGDKSLVITNYPLKGPIISGPYVQPFICTTATFRLPDGTMLGNPTDAQVQHAVIAALKHDGGQVQPRNLNPSDKTACFSARLAFPGRQ